MLAIEVEYLLGRAVATDTTQRDRAEWPPHPSRLFSALVDALADVGHESREEHATCESALRWLEALPAPRITASVDDDVAVRTPVKFWVPINDEAVERVRSAPLSEQRKRQERFFPAAVPTDPVVVFAWPGADPSEDQLRALRQLAGRVPYLGHSSSVVRVAPRTDAPPATLCESGTGQPYRLRVPGPGRLDRLNAVHELRKKDTLIQPPRGREVVYRRVGKLPPARGPFVAARVVAIEGLTFDLVHTATLLRQYRAALLSVLGDDAPGVLTGHRERGKPIERTHIAYVPLAHVGSEFADGSIKGIAVVLPQDMEDEDVLRLERAMARVRNLVFGARGELAVRSLGTSDGRRSLDFGTYSRDATTWVSVTPVVLGLHPRPSKGLTEEDVVRREFVRAGLPEPEEVELQDVSFVRGAPRAREVLSDGISAIRGRLVRHIRVRFDVAVRGPVLVGAGRYMGFGVLRPQGERT